MKRMLALMLGSVTLMLTACGKLPETFPGISEDSAAVDMGERYKVNVFFQNNENTFALRKDGTVEDFFKCWTKTVSDRMYDDTSKTYITQYDPASQQFSLVEYNRNNYGNKLWEEARKDYAAEGASADAEQSLYVMDGRNGVPSGDAAFEEKRPEGGILRLFVDEVKKVDVMRYTRLQNAEEETTEAENAASEPVAEQQSSEIFDPDAINVIFTDLSEKGIIDLGDDLFTYYTADNRYNACVLAIKLEMNPGEPIYYASRNNSDSLTKNAAGGSRWFYLLMMGPSTHLASFVDSLTKTLEEGRVHRGAATGGYERSLIYNTAEIFNRDEDIRIHMADANDPDQQALIQNGSPDAVFENASVRLEPLFDRDSAFPVGALRDNIMEYRYTSRDKAFGLKGYNGAGTKDFSLCIDLTKEADRHDLVADTTPLDYVFGEPVVYLEGSKGWAEMDPDHKERFFKQLSVEENDGKKLMIISDNADECDHHNVYITVPVLQRATVSQVVGENINTDTQWVSTLCNFTGSDPKEEVKRTYFFNTFYANLFDMKLEGETDQQMVVYGDTKYLYAQIDELKILIEDIH